MERLVQFSLLGQNYRVYTGTSKEEMEQILDLIYRAVDETTTEGGGTLPASKAAVMVSLNIASKYVRLKEEFDQYRIDMEKRIGFLNEQIDTNLFPESSRRKR